MHDVVAGLVAFVVAEPATYLMHRVVFHHLGWPLHLSHHREDSTGAEANDLFPLLIATTTIAVMALWPGTRPYGAGVTLYGAAYFFVHDLYIHRRFGLVRREIRGLDELRRRHLLHHRDGGEPYGLLLPLLPKSLASTSRLGP